MPATYVDEDRGYISPCWIWQGTIDRCGYARVKHDGKTAVAHRPIYEIHRGPIPAGLELDHLCRQRDCVNPYHHEPVTHAENTRRAILANKPAYVDLIPGLLAQGMSQGAIGRLIGINQSTVSRIARGLRYQQETN